MGKFIKAFVIAIVSFVSASGFVILLLVFPIPTMLVFVFLYCFACAYTIIEKERVIENE